MSFLIGLTGNIACGKSSVGQLLAERYGADYIDADRLIHSLYAAGTPETMAIAQQFGADLLKSDGTIDRRRLGDLVLGNPPGLRQLEEILQPGVRKAIDDRIANATAPVVVLDAIRLIESGLAARCDAVWVVVCDPTLQSARLQASRGFTAEQADLRIASQRPQAEKVASATDVLTNDGTLDALVQQISAAWQKRVAPYLVQSSPP